jgi:long-chain fatty acid transport protein
MGATYFGGWEMSFRGLKAVQLACVGIAALIAATADANAGGFAIREQSAYGQGASFAGIAAGGDLSAMFWNPAVMTQIPGIQTASSYTGIFPYSNQNVLPGSSFFGVLPGVGNSGDAALVPGSYFSYQIRPDLWLGMSVNAPFGLSVSFPDYWAGRNYSGDTTLSTYNAVPTIAYRINNWISIGAGVQIQYAHADLTTGLPINGVGTPGLAALGNQFNINGNGWGFGFTAGVTLTPTPTTTIGLGYRSAINQKINGTLSLPAGPAFTPAAGSTPGSVSTTLNLPDIVSLGIRQRLDAQWTLLGTAEWSNWSRIGTATALQPSGAAATIVNIPVALPFQYQDGWFFSAGVEYVWTDRLTVRGGVGYEISPITDQVRTPRLPDNDRIWLSAGATWEIWKGFSANLAYSHLFVRDTPINISAGSGNPWFNPAVPIAYVGNVDSHVDIISVGLKYRWDSPAPAQTALITK